MLGAASALTVVTLTGLAAGFAREWLLVAGWGAGARTDAFLVAMFLPEALRMILSNGLLSSAGLALWNEQPPAQRAAWLSSTTATLALGAVGVAALLGLGATLWISVVGPGLSAAQHEAGVESLRWLAWVIPGIALHAWWSVPMQSQGRFLLPGFGSLVFNVPAIAYMALARTAATEQGIALGFLAGSVLMVLPLAAPALRMGLQPALMRVRKAPVAALWIRLLPLATSAVAGQGLFLLERIVASFLGDGALTVINLARKLINLPLVALGSLNQVLLGLMSRQAGGERLDLLRRGIATVTIVSLPAAAVLILASDAIVALLFGGIPGHERIGPLLAVFAACVVFAGWNAVIARFSYAAGDTRHPLVCELSGSALQALLLPLLAWQFQEEGVALSVFFATLLTGHLLLRRKRLWGALGIGTQLPVSAAVLVAAGAAMPLMLYRSVPVQLVLAAVAAALGAVLLAMWLKPWARGRFLAPQPSEGPG